MLECLAHMPDWRLLLACGIAFWSLATALGGFAEERVVRQRAMTYAANA